MSDTELIVLIASTLCFLFPILVLGFSRPSLLGLLTVTLNLLSLPCLLLGGLGVVMWFVALLFAIIDRSTAQRLRAHKELLKALQTGLVHK